MVQENAESFDVALPGVRPALATVVYLDLKREEEATLRESVCIVWKIERSMTSP